MANLRLTCASCGSPLDPEEAPGPGTVCPRCGRPVQTPGPSAAEGVGLPGGGFAGEKKGTATIPKFLGGFELLEKIGAGGMGTVFKARQVSLNKIVALKVLKPSLARNQKFVERFRREARSAAKLNHPNIVTAIEVGEAEGYHFFAMEYIEGETLARRVKHGGRLDEPAALDVAEQVALALSHAWKEGIIHRDIKPENIMLAASGEARVMDMGLAKSVEQGDATVTQAGGVIGTPAYASPEQLRGEVHDLDVRTDIYSLGCTLYFSVTGRMPFEGPTAAVIMARNLEETLPPVTEARPDLSTGFGTLLRRMVEKDRKKRYANPEELLAAIGKVRRGEPVESAAKPAAVASGAATGGAASGMGRLVGKARRVRLSAQKRSSSASPMLGLLSVTLVVIVLLALYVEGRRPEEEEWNRSRTTTSVARASPRPMGRPPQTSTSVRPAVSGTRNPGKGTKPAGFSPGGAASSPAGAGTGKSGGLAPEVVNELRNVMRAMRMGRETVDTAVALQVARLRSAWAFETPEKVEDLEPRLLVLRALVRDGVVHGSASSEVVSDWIEDVWTRKQEQADLPMLLGWRRWLRSSPNLSLSTAENLDEKLEKLLDDALAPLRGKVTQLEQAGQAAAALQEYESVNAQGGDLLPLAFHEEYERLSRAAGRGPQERVAAWTKWLRAARKSLTQRDYAAALALLREQRGELESLGPARDEEEADLLLLKDFMEAVQKALPETVGKTLTVQGTRGVVRQVAGQNLLLDSGGRVSTFSLQDLQGPQLLVLVKDYLRTHPQRARMKVSFLIHEGLPDEAEAQWREENLTQVQSARFQDMVRAQRAADEPGGLQSILDR
ncbi:MAG: serine/threonine protein kinase [Planctomycetes bacterium]|nr:serine/threonine protein kinase [Planctomycetota bacterium]